MWRRFGDVPGARGVDVVGGRGEPEGALRLAGEDGGRRCDGSGVFMGVFAAQRVTAAVKAAVAGGVRAWRSTVLSVVHGEGGCGEVWLVG